jgi:putative membrane protein
MSCKKYSKCTLAFLRNIILTTGITRAFNRFQQRDWALWQFLGPLLSKGDVMQGIAIRWLTLTGAIIFTSYLVDGIAVQGFFSAFFAAAALGIFNAFFRPIAILLTLPINILSLGLFTFIINAVMLKMASSIIAGFDVHGFWAAIIGSFFISIISWALNSFISEQGRFEVINLKHRGGGRWE